MNDSTYLPVLEYFINASKTLETNFPNQSGNVEENVIDNQSWWTQLLWCILFSGVVVVATGGNLIVIWIVLAHRRMRTVTNYFLVNLSIADAMVSTFNIIFNFSSMVFEIWPYGEAYCKISNFVAILSISASVFSLMAISIDRYMAIMHPLKPRMSKEMTLMIAGAIWVASVVISSPNIAYSTLIEDTVNGERRVFCNFIWPDGPSPLSYYEYIYNVLILVVTYILPITSMTFTYSRIGVELWGSQSIGECTNRQIESINSKRRIVRMMIVVVVIFAVCWLPYHVYFLLSHHYPEISNKPFIKHIYLFIYWLAMSNSMYNPLIYCWMNSRFRGGFKKVFRWCPGVRLTDTEMMYEKKPNRATMYSYSYGGGNGDHARLNRNGMANSRNGKFDKTREIEFTELTRTAAAGKVDL